MEMGNNRYALLLRVFTVVILVIMEIINIFVLQRIFSRFVVILVIMEMGNNRKDFAMRVR